MVAEALERAFDIAGNSDFREQMGAVVLNRKGRIIAEGFNRRKTHPLQAKIAKFVKNDHRIFLHAEIAAIVRCKHHNEAHTIVITRKMTDGNKGKARPCDICCEAIKRAGIRKIIYTETDGSLREINVNSL